MTEQEKKARKRLMRRKLFPLRGMQYTAMTVTDGYASWTYADLEALKSRVGADWTEGLRAWRLELASRHWQAAVHNRWNTVRELDNLIKQLEPLPAGARRIGELRLNGEAKYV